MGGVIGGCARSCALGRAGAWPRHAGAQPQAHPCESGVRHIAPAQPPPQGHVADTAGRRHYLRPASHASQLFQPLPLPDRARLPARRPTFRRRPTYLVRGGCGFATGAAPPGCTYCALGWASQPLSPAAFRGGHRRCSLPPAGGDAVTQQRPARQRRCGTQGGPAAARGSSVVGGPCRGIAAGAHLPGALHVHSCSISRACRRVRARRAVFPAGGHVVCCCRRTRDPRPLQPLPAPSAPWSPTRTVVSVTRVHTGAPSSSTVGEPL